MTAARYAGGIRNAATRSFDAIDRIDPAPERRIGFLLGGREARGRQCEAPGCSTVLSTYNRSRTCYLHTMPEYRHALQR